MEEPLKFKLKKLFNRNNKNKGQNLNKFYGGHTIFKRKMVYTKRLSINYTNNWGSSLSL